MPRLGGHQQQQTSACVLRAQQQQDGGGLSTSCLSYLALFVQRLGKEPQEASPTQIQYAWRSLQQSRNWSPKHTTTVRTRLYRALCVASCCEAAYVINPAGRTIKEATTFHSTRSFLGTFTLHECLPIRVRHLGPQDAHYETLTRLARDMVQFVRSVSRKGLQGILAVLDGVVWGLSRQQPAALAPHRPTASDKWGPLARVSSYEWLEAYRTYMTEGRRRQTRCVSFDRLRRHLRYLKILHGRVLCGPGKPIPIDHTHTVILQPPGNDDNHHGDLRVVIAQLRDCLCHKLVAKEVDITRAYAFSCQEVSRMINQCGTVPERLVLMLFLTTGLRIGGLSRLQWVPADDGCNNDTNGPDAVVDQQQQPPKHVWTVEKGNKIRRITLSDTCRILLVQWYTETGRWPVTSSSPTPLFPRSGTHWIWQVCRGIFQRSGLGRVRHAHPHTFRHTVVHMLYMCGLPFDRISKWIGHSSVATTSGVYGRLRHDDIQTLVHGVPFVPSPTDAAQQRNSWMELAELLRAPYVFSLSLWQMVTTQSTTTVHHPLLYVAVRDLQVRLDALVGQPTNPARLMKPCSHVLGPATNPSPTTGNTLMMHAV